MATREAALGVATAFLLGIGLPGNADAAEATVLLPQKMGSGEVVNV